MRAFGLLNLLTSRVVKVIDLSTCLMLAAIVVIGGLELCARNIFNHSFVWAHEVTILLANWVYFLGVCIVYEQRGDVTVGVVSALLKNTRLRRLWAAACDVISAIVFATIAWYGWELLKLQAPFHTTGLRIPNPAFSAPAVIGAVVLALLSIRHALADLLGEDEAQAVSALV